MTRRAHATQASSPRFNYFSVCFFFFGSFCSQRTALHQWRTAMLCRTAQELMEVRDKARMCQGWSSWRLVCLQPDILYARLLQSAVLKHSHRCLRTGMLGLGWHAYQASNLRDKHQALLLHTWGKQWKERCWRRWRHVHGAIIELRLRHVCLESKCHVLYTKFAAGVNCILCCSC